jgi:hypothetical protein
MPMMFEQQARESDKAFAAFRAYLDMGPQRSLAAVGKKLGKSQGLMERWSAKFEWPARVQAYMAMVAEQERLAIEVRAVEKAVEWEKMHEGVRREAWKEAEETIAMVRKARAEWIEKGRVPGWEGMARMLELAFKLKQIATGLGEGDRQNSDDSPTVRVEVNVALAKIYGEPLPGEVVDVEAVPVSGDSLATIADSQGGKP